MSKRKSKTNGNLTMYAYQHIRDMIAQEILKAGDELQEASVAATLEISRTPVKNAIYRLEADGLIEIVPNKGYFVKRYDFNDYIDMLQVREVLEGLSAVLACRKCTPGDIVKLQALFRDRTAPYDPNQRETYFQMGQLLHKEIIRIADNRFITRQLALIELLSNIVTLRSAQIASRPEQAYYEHIAILEAIEQRDAALAERRIRNHIRQLGMCMFQTYFDFPTL